MPAQAGTIVVACATRPDQVRPSLPTAEFTSAAPVGKTGLRTRLGDKLTRRRRETDSHATAKPVLHCMPRVSRQDTAPATDIAERGRQRWWRRFVKVMVESGNMAREKQNLHSLADRNVAFRTVKEIMGKTHFTVVAILPGRRDDYFDFWTNDVKVNRHGEDLHPDMLAITIGVDAHSKIDAENQVRQRYPDHAIDSAATRRHG
jgi:hypothetical protein